MRWTAASRRSRPTSCTTSRRAATSASRGPTATLLTQVNVDGTRAVLDACVARRRRARARRRQRRASTAPSPPTRLPVGEHARCRRSRPYGEEQGRREAVALAAHRDARAPGRLHAGVQPHRARVSRTTFLVPGLAARIVAAERDGDATRSRSATATRSATSATCATSCARTGCSSKRGVAGEVYNVCSGRGVARRRPGCAAHRPRSTSAARHHRRPRSCRPVEVPVLVGDPGKLVTATGWTPEHSLDDTLDDVLAARGRPDASAPSPLCGHVGGTGLGLLLGTWRASQPRSVAMARGSWRRRWPAPCTTRSSSWAGRRRRGRARRRPAPRRPPRRAARAADDDRGASPPRSRRPVRCRAPSGSSRPGTPRCGSCPSPRVLEQATGILRPVAQRARRRDRRHAAHQVVVGGVAHRERPAVAEARDPHPAHVGDARAATRTALRRSASQPCAEKSPSDVPVPRKLKVSTAHPASLAMRSARSG